MSGVDLCTLADVRALMGKRAGDVAQDGLIETLITRASTKIMRDYGREFVPGGPDGLPSVAATRTFEYQWAEQSAGEAFVDFMPYDLQTSPTPVVAVDTDRAAPITISSEEWRLWPKPPTDRVYLAIKVLPLNVSVGLVGWRKREVQITGNWGFPSIPADVTLATAQTVVHWVTAYPPALRPEAYDEGAPVTSPRSYPMSAVDLLRSFKRMTV